MVASNKIFVVFIGLSIFGGVLCQFPKSINRCKSGDVSCIKEVATQVLRNHPNGFPELKIPNIEPFHMDKVEFGDNEDQSIGFKLTLTDLKFYGLSNFNISKIVGFEKDPLKSKFEIYGVIPKLTNKAHYKISGKVLLLPIDGEGEVEYEMEKVSIGIKMKPKIKQVRDGKTYLVVDKYKISMDVKKMKINMTNLFNGDKTLGDSMNKVLNENWKTMWTELKPSVSKLTSDFTAKILNDLFSVVPYEESYSDTATS